MPGISRFLLDSVWEALNGMLAGRLHEVLDELGVPYENSSDEEEISDDEEERSDEEEDPEEKEPPIHEGSPADEGSQANEATAD
jgi:hypothetical protein